MAGLYLDTSALGRILLAEPDAIAIRQTRADYDAWWSSALLIVELRRLAARENLEAIAERMLTGVRTVAVDTASIERASRLQPPEVRTLDAIHLDAAVPRAPAMSTTSETELRDVRHARRTQRAPENSEGRGSR